MTDKSDDVLLKSAKEAHYTAKQLMFAGAVPTYLGIPGMLALMADSIRRYAEEPTRKDLLTLVAHGLHALSIDTEEKDWEEIVVDEDEDDEEDEDDVVPTEEQIINDLIDNCKHPSKAIEQLTCQICGTYVGDTVDEASDQSIDPRFQPAPGSAKTELPLFDVDNEIEGGDDER